MLFINHDLFNNHMHTLFYYSNFCINLTYYGHFFMDDYIITAVNPLYFQYITLDGSSLTCDDLIRLGKAQLKIKVIQK